MRPYIACVAFFFCSYAHAEYTSLKGFVHAHNGPVPSLLGDVETMLPNRYFLGADAFIGPLHGGDVYLGRIINCDWKALFGLGVVNGIDEKINDDPGTLNTVIAQVQYKRYGLRLTHIPDVTYKQHITVERHCAPPMSMTIKDSQNESYLSLFYQF